MAHRGAARGEREAADGTTIFYDQQGLSTLTVSGDYLYAFTAAADWSQTYEAGRCA